MAIYQRASDRPGGLPFIGGLLRLVGSDRAMDRLAGRPAPSARRRTDDRPVAGRRPVQGRRAAERSASVALRPAASGRAGATPRSKAGARPVAPKARAAAVAARPTVPARSVAVHHRRALPRNAAQVGRRTIAVAVHRPRTAALGIASVAAVLIAVLFYLSQMFQVAAARYELDALATERVLLLQELRTQDGQVAGLAAEAVVRDWAQDADLDWKDRRQRFEAR